MAEIKWIKLSTTMFEDEKIRLIEYAPQADTILIIWIKLLALAGKTNASGYIFLNKNIPYTEEMLATLFGRPLPVLRMALKTLLDFGMIEINQDNYICITNWEKHQNIAGLDRVRQLNADRNKKYREKKKQQQLALENKGDDVAVTSRDATEEELELDIDKEKDKKNSSQNASQVDVSLANRLFKLMKGNNPYTKEPKNKDRWVDTFRLMRERDKISVQDIEAVIEWCQNDSFWSNNILSPKKLREKFPTLYGQMTSKKKGNGNYEANHQRPQSIPGVQGKAIF